MNAYARTFASSFERESVSLLTKRKCLTVKVPYTVVVDTELDYHATIALNKSGSTLRRGDLSLRGEQTLLLFFPLRQNLKISGSRTSSFHPRSRGDVETLSGPNYPF